MANPIMTLTMATPVVAGAAALYMSAVGHVSPAVMEKVLKASVSKSLSSQIGAGIIDAAKMFSADKTKPVITVTDAYGNEITSFKNAVPYGSTVSLASATGINGAMIVYTLDGKTPTIKNGEIVTGQKYTEPISLDSFPVGKSVTVKAACISGMRTSALSSPLVRTGRRVPGKPSPSGRGSSGNLACSTSRSRRTAGS